MTDRGDASEVDVQDEAFLADLFDTLLQQILDGGHPDVAALQQQRPELRDQIQQTWALACSVAGRREPGRPVLGGYEILRELGHGGMGTVYLARHQDLQREVAIKVLPQSLAMSPHAKQRFLEEARALARLRHDHVVHVHRILDHGEMLAFEMEFVDGPNLRTLLTALRQKTKPQAITSLAEVLGLPVETLGTRSTVEWFVRVGIKIARALGEVHRHGLVHRDVKPSNILLRTNGQPVLADFGLAREDDLEVTHASFAGTPVYAAPERLRSGDADVDARADVYSLGVTLYEAMTLDAPFGGKTTHEVLRRIEEGSLPSLRKRAPHVPHDLEVVIGKAMETDRRHRYATADDLADDLERLLSLQPIKAQPVAPLRRAWKFVRRHQKLAMAAAGGAVLVAAVTWPVLAHARARTAAIALADRERQEARSGLLCPENLYSSWSPARQGAAQQTLRMSSVRDAQLAELEQALRHYDRALEATPDDRDLVVERAVVRAVTRLLHGEALADAQVAADRAEVGDLPPLTAALVQQAAIGEVVDDAGWNLVADATACDRFTAGLFAFLRNDHDASERCWEDAALPPSDQTFRDACLSLQMTAQGSHDRALPRLFQAVRAFPRSTALAFAMAESAILANDLELGEQWLRAVPDTSGSSIAHAQRKRLETDILAARGDYEAAWRGYVELQKADATDPEPVQRQAALALRQGAVRLAQSIYRDTLRRWPGLAQPRLQLARLALKQHHLFDYLDVARHVMQQDLSRLPHGAASHLVDVLRIGGLHALHKELCATVGLLPGAVGADDLTPLATWLRPSQIKGIEQALRTLQVFDRSMTTGSRIDQRPVAAAIRATWHTLLELPSLATVVTWPAYGLLVLGLPANFDAATRWLGPLVLPYQQALGNRMVTVKLDHLFAKTLTDLTYVYGYQVVRVGDLNGDSLEELCVTAPPFGATSGGYLDLRNLGDGSLQRTWDSEESVAFARAVVALDDIDGDLSNDLLIGAPLQPLSGPARASVSLRSGRTGAVIWEIEDDTRSFGTALANLGDLDGDGADDFVVGVPPMRLHGQERGRAVVCSGRTGRPIYDVTAEQNGVWFGGAVANAGDVNGDGVDDLLVGGNFGRAAGVVSVYDGRNGSLLASFGEDDTEADFGANVTGLGDIDGDGLADIGIAAPGRSSAGRQPGTVHILSGRTGRTLYELRGDRDGDGFGSVLCRMPWYRPPNAPALAISAREGGAAGTGYVRVFDTETGKPMQTMAGTSQVRLWGFSLVDLGDLDGDTFRDLGVSTLTPSGYSLMLVNYGQTPLDQRDH